MTGSIMLKNFSQSHIIGYTDTGVYILKLSGVIQKVGSAKLGLKKRMQQYYDLNKWCGLNKYINKTNRDLIEVVFQTCDKKDCRELESKLFDKYDIAKMPWAKRRPRSSKNTVQLLI